MDGLGTSIKIWIPPFATHSMQIFLWQNKPQRKRRLSKDNRASRFSRKLIKSNKSSRMFSSTICRMLKKEPNNIKDKYGVEWTKWFFPQLYLYTWYRNKYYLLSLKSGKFKNSPSLFHFIFTLRELPGPDKLASQCNIAGLFRTTTTSSGSWRNLNSLNLWSNFRKEPAKQKKKHLIRCFHTLCVL